MNENSVPFLAYGLITLTSMMLAYVTVLDKSEPRGNNEKVPEVIAEQQDDVYEEEQQEIPEEPQEEIQEESYSDYYHGSKSKEEFCF